MNKIDICFGSSCFCRGNNEFLEIIEEFIEQHGDKIEIDLRGKSCKEKCSEGPLISINGKELTNIDRGVLIDTLNQLK